MMMTLEEFKLNYQETTGCYTEPEKERSRLKQLATTEHLKNASILTQILNTSGIKQLFWHNRILCRALTGNANLGYLLRIIVCRWLTNDQDECFLKYRDDIGYTFWHTAKDFAAETGISIHTIYKLIPKLRDEGWIEIYYKQDVFGRVKWHIKLQVETFIKRLITYAQSQLVSFTNCNLQNLPIVSYINQIIKNNMEQKTECAQKNISTQEEEETRDVSVKKDKEITNSLVSNLNCPKTTNVSQVDEKVNNNSELPKPRLKKDMHYPEGDRYFNTSNQQSEIRNRAKKSSVVGMSGFKDIEQVEEFGDRATEYYLEIFDFETAQRKVNFEIDNAVRNGRRSQLIKEFLKGEALGVAFKQEWEAKRGVLLPAFTAYLQHQLRRDGDTPEQVRVKIYWFRKDGENLRSAWAECKRIINIQKPKLKQAVELGRDLNATDIPSWFIEAFRPEIEISEIVETAEVLGAIAVSQTTRVYQHQQRLSGSEEGDIPELEESHPISQLLSSKGVLGVSQATERLAAEPTTSKSTDVEPEVVNIDGINCLLADPITRDRGVFLAQQQDLPLLLNSEGVAIGIESSQHEERHGAAHEIYTPPKIEKGSFSALKEAIAKSKFLKNRRKTMSD